MFRQPRVAELAGHSVHVLLKVYAKCIDGQDEAARRRIEGALRPADDGLTDRGRERRSRTALPGAGTSSFQAGVQRDQGADAEVRWHAFGTASGTEPLRVRLSETGVCSAVAVEGLGNRRSKAVSAAPRSGGRGIRTHEEFPLTGFQDRRHRPLGEPSSSDCSQSARRRPVTAYRRLPQRLVRWVVAHTLRSPDRAPRVASRGWRDRFQVPEPAWSHLMVDPSYML